MAGTVQDALEVISTERETIKSEISNDVRNYIYNVIKSPDIFSSIYYEHLPKYVADLIINKINIDLSPEDVLILKGELLTDYSQLLKFFYQDLRK